MPTYQYACTESTCGHRFDAVQAFSDEPLDTCPVCEGRLRKVFSAVGVVFKGSGFYHTDSRAESRQGNKDDTKDKADATQSGSAETSGAANSSESGSTGKSAGSSGSDGSSGGSNSTSGSSGSSGSAGSSSPATSGAARSATP